MPAVPQLDGRAMRLATFTSWAAALLLVALAAPASAQKAAAGGCELSLWANPVSSSFKLGGEVVEPVSMALDPTHPEAKVGLQGRVVLSLAGACPEDAAALEAALLDAVFKTSADSPLLLYPSEGYTVRGQGGPGLLGVPGALDCDVNVSGRAGAKAGGTCTSPDYLLLSYIQRCALVPTPSRSSRARWSAWSFPRRRSR